MKKAIILITLIGIIIPSIPAQAFELGVDKGQHCLFFCSWYILGFYTLHKGFNFSREDASRWAAISAIAAGATKEVYDASVKENKDADYWADTSLDLLFDGIGIGIGMVVVIPF